ncbi:hypothetical protein CC85DRAFT_327112, partial [Cutaneotrichosporon oleaginosum]
GQLPIPTRISGPFHTQIGITHSLYPSNPRSPLHILLAPLPPDTRLKQPRTDGISGARLDVTSGSLSACHSIPHLPPDHLTSITSGYTAPPAVQVAYICPRALSVPPPSPTLATLPSAPPPSPHAPAATSCASSASRFPPRSHKQSRSYPCPPPSRLQRRRRRHLRRSSRRSRPRSTSRCRSARTAA